MKNFLRRRTRYAGAASIAAAELNWDCALDSMSSLCRAIAAFSVLFLGIIALNKGLFVAFGLSVLVAACIFFPPERYSGIFAGKRRWVVALGVVVLFVVFVAEANIAKRA